MVPRLFCRATNSLIYANRRYRAPGGAYNELVLREVCLCDRTVSVGAKGLTQGAYIRRLCPKGELIELNIHWIDQSTDN